jgi:hypothetical protein
MFLSVPEQNGLRQRKKSGGQDSAPPWRVPAEGINETEDLDTVIKHQQEMQEKLAEEMVSLARNMKDHASAAHRIVKDDTKVGKLKNVFVIINPVFPVLSHIFFHSTPMFAHLLQVGANI